MNAPLALQRRSEYSSSFLALLLFIIKVHFFLNIGMLADVSPEFTEAMYRYVEVLYVVVPLLLLSLTYFLVVLNEFLFRETQIRIDI